VSRAQIPAPPPIVSMAASGGPGEEDRGQ